MLSRKRLSLLLAPLLAGALMAPPAGAGEPTEILRAGISGVLEILLDPDLKAPEKKAERRSRIRGIIHRYFDFEAMSRRSLARSWRKRSPEEKREFVRLFSRLMERNYADKLESYTDEKIVFGKETIDEEFARVESKVILTDEREVAIAYRMHRVEGEWRVYDVLVEGISFLKNYREQFRSVIRRTSYANLVKMLRARRDGD